MNRHWMALLSLWPWTGCMSDGLIADPSLDSWCGESLCHFTTDQGRIERVGTWHTKDYGVSFVEKDTRISQLSEQGPVDCIRFDLIADVDAHAQLLLELDFNDDSRIEKSIPISDVRWANQGFVVRPPPEYESVRFILRKTGTGRAVVAQIKAAKNPRCDGDPILLEEGSRCTSHLSCRLGRCAGEQCIACPKGGCEAGAACSEDAQCLSGDCAPRQARGEQDRHDSDACAECGPDRDCDDGVCFFGMCVGCTVDGDCAEGEVCRYADPFDPKSRACLPPAAAPAPRPRGALCESPEDCDGELACAAAPGLLPRCGKACRGGACGTDELCATPGLDRPLDLHDLLMILSDGDHDHGDFAPNDVWSTPSGRVATCYPLPDLEDDPSCELHVQCLGSVCCEGRCLDPQLNAEMCPPDGGAAAAR